MIHSVGIDVVEVARVRKAIDRWGERFIRRVFTPWEINYCYSKAFPEQSFAARFAAKEAVLKAIGVGLNHGIRWTSIEIVNDDSGQPKVRLGQSAKAVIGTRSILISMSHTKEHAVATAIMITDGKA